MSYDTSAVGNNNNESSSAEIMREERTIDPYRTYQTRLKSLEGSKPIGQPPVDKGTENIPNPVPVPEKTEETVKLSPQMAALARREQQFRKQQQQFEEDKKKLSSEKEELAQLRQMKEKLASKDYSGLDGLVNYEDYSQYQVNKLNGTDPVQEEIKKLNGKISEIEKNAQENVNKQFEAAVAERRIAVSEIVDKTDKYPGIKKSKANEAVVQHILDTWEHDNEELSVEQAAKEVEELLLDRAKQWAALLEEEKKPEPLEEKNTGTKQLSEQPQKKPLPSLKQQSNNELLQSVLKAPVKSLAHLNDAERWAEARRRAAEKLERQKQG